MNKIGIPRDPTAVERRTREEIEREITELEAANAAAPGWGAAVGARAEHIRDLKRELAALPATPPRDPVPSESEDLDYPPEFAAGVPTLEETVCAAICGHPILRGKFEDADELCEFHGFVQEQLDWLCPAAAPPAPQSADVRKQLADEIDACLMEGYLDGASIVAHLSDAILAHPALMRPSAPATAEELADFIERHASEWKGANGGIYTIRAMSLDLACEIIARFPSLTAPASAASFMDGVEAAAKVADKFADESVLAAVRHNDDEDYDACEEQEFLASNARRIADAIRALTPPAASQNSGANHSNAKTEGV